MNVPNRFSGPPPGPAERLVLAATTAFLVAAPFSASAGIRATALIVTALALAFILRRTGLPAWTSLPRALVVAWLAWCLLAIASIAWSVDRGYTLSELRSQALYGTLALFGYYLAADARRWILWAVALLGGALAAFATQEIQAVLPFAMSRHPMDGGAGPWSTHLVLLAPALLALAWPRPWGLGLHAAWAAAAVAFVIVAAWDSGNRILWPAFALQLTVVAVLWRHMPPIDPARMKTLRRLLVVGALAVAAAFFAAIVERNERLFGEQPVTTHLEHDLRPGIWRTARTLIAESPWVGHGFGREIRAAEFRHHTLGAGHPEIRHAHNMFIDMWLQLGVAGLIALLAILALLGREYALMLRVPAVAPWGVIGLAVLAGFIAKNLTDDFLHRHNAIVFWALNGMLVGLGRRR